jgi:hypothetical protein
LRAEVIAGVGAELPAYANGHHVAAKGEGILVILIIPDV